MSHASGAGLGAPASEHVGESEGRSLSDKKEDAPDRDPEGLRHSPGST